MKPVLLILSAALCSAQPKLPCSRECLEGLLNQYLDAMVARNPLGLSLAPRIKFTGNNQLLESGAGRVLRRYARMRLHRDRQHACSQIAVRAEIVR